jgi:RNA polymerase sigma-70 factor (ECF subfamily)
MDGRSEATAAAAAPTGAASARARLSTPALVRAAVVDRYDALFPRVHRYIAVRIGSTDAAEDLAADVFVRALRAATSYKDTGRPIEAWIFRIAHNLVVDHLRKRERSANIVPLTGTEQIDSGERTGERLERAQDIALLNQALEHLTEAQRQVIALRFGAGLRSDTVGEMLGKNAGAVRYLQHAAIEKLRKVLANMGMEMPSAVAGEEAAS